MHGKVHSPRSVSQVPTPIFSEREQQLCGSPYVSWGERNNTDFLSAEHCLPWGDFRSSTHSTSLTEPTVTPDSAYPVELSEREDRNSVVWEETEMLPGLEISSAWRGLWPGGIMATGEHWVRQCSQEAVRGYRDNAVAGARFSTFRQPLSTLVTPPKQHIMRYCHIISGSCLHSGIFPDRTELFAGMVASADGQPKQPTDHFCCQRDLIV